MISFNFSFLTQIKKPRSSSFIRLVLLPSEHTVHKVDTLSQFAIINSDLTTLWFAMPYAALSMNGSYAILMDRGAVVGQGCSYDGPPTPGITNTSDWQFTAGVCPVGYTLAPPDFSNCVGNFFLITVIIIYSKCFYFSYWFKSPANSGRQEFFFSSNLVGRILLCLLNALQDTFFRPHFSAGFFSSKKGHVFTYTKCIYTYIVVIAVIVLRDRSLFMG